MTFLWQVARIGGIVAVILFAIALLPDAPESLDELTIPSVVFDPLVSVLQLDRYFPIATLLGIASAAIAIRVGMATLWLYSWIAKHVFGS